MSATQRKTVGPDKAAEMLGVSVKTVYRWIRSKKLPSSQPGRSGRGFGAKILIPVDGVLALAAGQGGANDESSAEPIEHPEFVFRKDAIKLLGFSLSKLHRLEDEGVLTKVPDASGKVRYRWSEVDALLTPERRAAWEAEQKSAREKVKETYAPEVPRE